MSLLLARVCRGVVESIGNSIGAIERYILLGEGTLLLLRGMAIALAGRGLLREGSLRI